MPQRKEIAFLASEKQGVVLVLASRPERTHLRCNIIRNPIRNSLIHLATPLQAIVVTAVEFFQRSSFSRLEWIFLFAFKTRMSRNSIESHVFFSVPEPMPLFVPLDSISDNVSYNDDYNESPPNNLEFWAHDNFSFLPSEISKHCIFMIYETSCILINEKAASLRCRHELLFPSCNCCLVVLRL